MTSDVIEFIDSDAAYQDWLHAHPDGYVLNAWRSKNPYSTVLHGAWCKQVSNYGKISQPGSFTERGLIKICASDVESLRDWVRQHGRSGWNFRSEECYCLKK